MSAAMDFFSKELKNEFETALVNEPSVFLPSKFYCIWDFFTAGGSFIFRCASLLQACCVSVLLSSIDIAMTHE